MTRLALPQVDSSAAASSATFDVMEVAALADRLQKAFAYSGTGRVEPAHLAVTGLDRRTEINPQRVLNLHEWRPSLAARDRMRRL